MARDSRLLQRKSNFADRIASANFILKCTSLLRSLCDLNLFKRKIDFQTCKKKNEKESFLLLIEITFRFSKECSMHARMQKIVIIDNEFNFF